jgi:divalent metal cation (Fe/Co/Zn/Cd) transporter
VLAGRFLTRPGAAAPRERWTRWARTLAWLTIGYNLVEGLVSMGFGAAEESVALFGFGADSFIEVGAAILVLWRLRADAAANAGERLARERRAAGGIGTLFLALALGIATGAVLQLAAGSRPDTTVPGVAVSLVSLWFMLFLWREKRRAARALDSRTLASDAACSLACMKLSAVLLAGSLLFLLAPGLWWADATGAIVLAFFIAREGWEMFRAAWRPEFSAGCGRGE